MPKHAGTRVRLFAALCAVASVVAADLSVFAQAGSCNQLNNSLVSLSSNRDYRNLESNSNELRSLAGELRDMESLFVRGGCQRLMNNGQALTGPCREVARRINQGRNAYGDIARRVETGEAVARQREMVLQEVARFGCGSSSANVNTQQPERRRSLLEEIFEGIFGPGNEGDIVGDDYDPYWDAPTVRTLCVRQCDGYYWPVSFATVPDYLEQDASICQAQGNGAEVALYYHRNPGEDAEQMVNLRGERYADLENAFRYRREFDASCTSKPEVNYGSVEIQEVGGQSRAVINFGDIDIPLPLRDPRRPVGETIVAAETIVADTVQVPLPRPRPDPDGNVPVVQQASTTEVRQVRFGDRLVRIVGPDTPYAQVVAGGL